MQLKIDVLPAPFGPIIACKDPSLMSKKTLLRAFYPPKLNETSLKEIKLLMRATFSSFYNV